MLRQGQLIKFHKNFRFRLYDGAWNEVSLPMSDGLICVVLDQMLMSDGLDKQLVLHTQIITPSWTAWIPNLERLISEGGASLLDAVGDVP